MGKDGYSRKGFFGQTIHYDSHGKKLGESRPNFWGGSNYHGTGSSHGYSQSVDDYDTIQSVLEDECFDSADATAWLEDNGYDPDDFDF